MKKRNTIKVLFCFLAIVLIIVISVLWFLRSVRNYIIADAEDANRRTVQLLYEADHDVLLEACRALAQKVDAGQLDKEQLLEIRYLKDREKLNLPEIILDLDPLYIVVRDSGAITIEMNGAIHHFGIVALPLGFDPNYYLSYPEEYKMLIEGLWYYDDGFHESDNYEKDLEAIRPEGNKRKLNFK